MLQKIAAGVSLLTLIGCGAIYIPQNFVPPSGGYGYHRTDHVDIEVIPMTFMSVNAANADGYRPRGLPKAFENVDPIIDISTRERIARSGLDVVDPAIQFEPLPSPPNIYDPATQVLMPIQKHEGLSLSAKYGRPNNTVQSTASDGAVPLYAMSTPVTTQRTRPTLPLSPPPETDRGALNPPPEIRPEPYRIGPGDVIGLLSRLQALDAVESDAIGILGDATKQLRVQGDGEIFIPQAGSVDIGGLTLAEARRVIFDKLIDNDLDFDFGVEILEFNSQSVAVSGLNGAQLLPITVRPITLGDAITAAGGLGLTPSNTIVRILRGKNIYELPGENLLSSRSFASRILQNGDAISISLIKDIDQALAYFGQELQMMSLEREEEDRVRAFSREVLEERRTKEEIKIANLEMRQGYLDRLRTLRDANNTARRTMEQDRRENLLANAAERAREREDRRALLELELQEERARLEQQAAQAAQTRDLFQQQIALGAIERDYVTIAGEVKSQTTFALPFDGRVTLNRILYETGGGPSVTTGDTSEIYVIRRPISGAKLERLVVYHLDASNAVNLAMATAFEMRPNDVVFLNSQPVTDWNRVIAQLLPSTSFLFGTAAGASSLGLN